MTNTTSLLQQKNECDVITIFPMTVECLVNNPSSQNATDGSLSISITGGTPPYIVAWSNGNISPAINNLGAGSYTAIVTDYSWSGSGPDYTATTTCVLTAPITPTTTTTTTVAPVLLYDICLTVYKQPSNYQIHFNPNGIYNGQYSNGYQSWISDDSVYQIVWGTLYQAWTVIPTPTNPSYYLLSPSPYPPLTGWYINGALGTVVSNQGPCLPLPSNPSFTYSLTQPTCICDGNIIITASNGTPPYQYSVDNGVTFTSNSGLFTGKCPGTYSLQIKDSLNNLSTVSTATLNNFIGITTYTLSLSPVTITTVNNNTTLTKQFTCTVNVSPPIPVGTTITFDAQHINQFGRGPASTDATIVTNSVLTKNSTVIPITSTPSSSNTSTQLGAGCQSAPIHNTTQTDNWISVSMTNGDTMVINTTTTMTKIQPVPNCFFAVFLDTFFAVNGVINGCSCCTLIMPNKAV
jgi:hypothetical protein